MKHQQQKKQTRTQTSNNNNRSTQLELEQAKHALTEKETQMTTLKQEKDELQNKLNEKIEQETKGDYSGTADANQVVFSDQETQQLAPVDKAKRIFAVLTNQKRSDQAFAVTHSPQETEKIVNDITESLDFLKRINKAMVKSKSGHKIWLGMDDAQMFRGPQSSTYVDNLNSRQTQYETMPRQFQWELKWEIADQWSHSKNLLAFARAKWAEAQALALEKNLFQGIAKDATTNDPLRVDKSIFQLLTDENSDMVLDRTANHNAITVGQVRTCKLSTSAPASAGSNLMAIPCNSHEFPVGTTVEIAGSTHYNGLYEVQEDPSTDASIRANRFVIQTSITNTDAFNGDETATLTPDYKNMDHFIAELYEMIDPLYKPVNPQIIIDRKLIHGDLTKAYSSIPDTTPSERKHLVDVTRQYVGMNTYHPLFMPAGKVFITDLKNISLYTQSGTLRTKYEEKDFERQSSTFQTYVNQCNVIEDVRRCVAAENVYIIQAT